MLSNILNLELDLSTKWNFHSSIVRHIYRQPSEMLYLPPSAVRFSVQFLYSPLEIHRNTAGENVLYLFQKTLGKRKESHP